MNRGTHLAAGRQQPAPPGPIAVSETVADEITTNSGWEPEITSKSTPNGVTDVNVLKTSEGLRLAGGSGESKFNLLMLRETLACARNPSTVEEVAPQIAAVRAALGAFKPADEIEGLLAAQAVALHFGAMECLRRAMLPDQPFEIASKFGATRYSPTNEREASVYTDVVYGRGRGSRFVMIWTGCRWSPFRVLRARYATPDAAIRAIESAEADGPLSRLWRGQASQPKAKLKPWTHEVRSRRDIWWRKLPDGAALVVVQAPCRSPTAPTCTYQAAINGTFLIDDTSMVRVYPDPASAMQSVERNAGRRGHL